MMQENNNPAPRIAVAVSSAQSGLHALNWALEKEGVPHAHGPLYLIHVQLRLRFVPNAMGPGKLPRDGVHPKKVQQLEKQHLSETEKLVDQYTRVCDEKKIKCEVLSSESDSVQKELVDQISKFRITKLVLGTSQNVLSRALKVGSISTYVYVAKHAPGFCEVLVVNKDKLCYVKKASTIFMEIPATHIRPLVLHAHKSGRLMEISSAGCSVLPEHVETLGELVTSSKLQQATKAAREKCEEALAALESAQMERERRMQQRLAEVELERDALAASLRSERQRYLCSEYSYEELQSATNGFNKENKIGEGGYGPVYRGKLRYTSVAIKVLAARDRSRGREEFQREVELLSRLRHPHILMLLGACPEKGCIVYEYMAQGSLADRLNCAHGTPPLPWYVRCRIQFEVATALHFLHSQQPQPIVHRDVKPGNILLDRHFVSKLGDAGLARLVPADLTFSVTMYKDSVLAGTFGYIDPDYQCTGVVSCESDVFSLGIVMLQLLTGKPAVGVTHLVEEAQKRGKLEEVLDKSAGEWPLEEARKLAQISLQCTAFKRRDRPKLGVHILPVLERIQSVAELAAPNRHGHLPWG